MLVILPIDAFTEVECSLLLKRLLSLAAEQRCYITHELEAEKELNNWLSNQGKDVQDAWRSCERWALKDQAQFRLRKRRVVPGGTGCAVPLLSAIRAVEQGTKIWVENSRNDRAFWLCVAGPRSRSILEHLEKLSVIEWKSVGGIQELRATLEDGIARSSLPFSNWVLMDSDGYKPGNKSSDTMLLEAVCQKIPTKHHSLSKRAIENYIPKKALYDAWVNKPAKASKRTARRKIVNAFYLMAEDQRSHFRMKKGFSKMSSAEELAIYAGVSNDCRGALHQGFGDDLADIFTTDADWMTQLYASEDTVYAETSSVIENILEWVRVPYA